MYINYARCLHRTADCVLVRPAMQMRATSALLLRRLALAAAACACAMTEHITSAAESLAKEDAVPLHFETKLFAIDLRPKTLTIDSLRPMRGATNLSFTYSNQPKPGYHNFGDITFRVGSPGPPPDAAAGMRNRHSIHCSDGTGDCIEGAPRHAATSSACGEACKEATACACWSYAVSTGACYLLSNATALPVADAAAACGWKASWSQAAAASRLRVPSSFSSAAAGPSTLPTVLPTPAGELLAVDLTPRLPGSPLHVSRHYSTDPERGDLLVQYEFSNPGKQAVELSSFGLSMIFD